MSKFEVRQVVRVASRKQFGLVGTVIEGAVKPGMKALVRSDDPACWSITIDSIEYMDRMAAKESLVGLLCRESDASDAQRCQDRCPPGTVIEVVDGAE